MMQAVHSITARAVNSEDKIQGRMIRYRNTCLTHERSYFARLYHTHVNPVKHEVIDRATNHEWCSKANFLRESNPVFLRAILSFPIDELNARDDF